MNLYMTALLLIHPEIDERVAQPLLDLDNIDLIFELCQLNGNPNSIKFDTFREELGTYLEEITPVVDD